MVSVFSCASCGFRFQSMEKKNCPRCSSVEVSEFGGERSKPGAPSTPGGTPKLFGGNVKSGKEGWQEFHSNEMKACIECGGTEFDLNWKRKEKTCRKCGAVLSLPRRSA